MATYQNCPLTTILLGTSNADGTFTGVTTGTSAAVDPGMSDQITFAVIGDGTITGGTLLIEEAYQRPGTTYAGTWHQLTSVTCTAITGNKQQIVAYTPRAFFAVRARFSADVTGGGGVTVVSKVQ